MQIIDPIKPDWRLLWPPLLGERHGYTWQTFRADAFAAATVAMVSIPQAVGFALLAGLPPAMVLGSVVVGGFFAAFFFSGRHIIFGPSNSLSLLLAATLVARQNSALGPAELAVLLALLIGTVQLAAGLLRFGQVTQYISRSVIIGYSAAIGTLLVFSQLHHLLGVESFKSNSLWAAPYHALLTAFSGRLNYYSVGTCVTAFLVFTLIKRLRPRWPETLVGLMLFCFIDGWFDLSVLGVSTLGQGNAIHASVPDFSGLSITTHELDAIRSLLVPTFALALLGMLEAVSISKGYGLKSGDLVDTNRELVAMGVGNIASACFASMPGSASFARSAASYQSGARTQMTGIISSFFVLAFVMLLAPFVNHLPVPALAVALIRVGWNLVDREQIRIAARSTRSDAVALGTTFAAAMLMPLDIAIYLGVGVALFLALRKASAPTLVEYVFNDFGNLTQRDETARREHASIVIIHVEGEMFFGAADLFQNHVRQQVERENLRVVILRLKSARHLDATTVFALRGLQDYLKKTGRHLLISGVHGEVLRVLKNSGVLDHIGIENIFPAELNPNLATKRALQRARTLLSAADSNVRIFSSNRSARPMEPVK